MDPLRGKPQHSLRSYRSAPQYNHYHENIKFSLPSSNGLLQASGIQRQSLKWKKDYYYRRNHKSKHPYRKNDANGKKSNKSEDVEEEERKKKLTDTAKKLLSKIKTWSAGNNCDQVNSENSSVQSEQIADLKNKPKRIAHSKKVKKLVIKANKKIKKPAKRITKYDVNKETVKDFQNRIQHKLMEEIMQMPKENLQNVLNDPKINPIMELKMSRLVRENRLLIAQKLRAIAESKMKSDCTPNPQFLVDIDKLIDPVIESDLSVLPYELIKQMENIFQVQFDYSPTKDNSAGENGNGNSVGESGNDNPQGESGNDNPLGESGNDNSLGESGNDNPVGEDVTCEITLDNEIPVEEESKSEKNIKVESNEDQSLYECSTDEDEEVGPDTALDSNHETSLNDMCELSNEAFETPEISIEDTVNNKINENQSLDGKSPENCTPLLENNFFPKKLPSIVPEELTKPTLIKQVSSTSCQTECNSSNASTQTQRSMTDSLYGAPLPKEATDDSIPPLLEELNSIQNLVNRLNERRMMIFLQLARMNPSGDFIGDSITKINFIETISNGNLYLVDALKEFFTSNRQGAGTIRAPVKHF